MNTTNFKKIASTAVATLLLAGIMPIVAMAAVPTVTGISSSSIPMGSTASTITVNGTNFDSTSQVTINGSPRPTTLVSSNQLNVSLTASDFATAGTFNVAVTNPGTGGGTSGNTTLTVTGNNPFPAISSMSPASIMAGSAAFTLTVNGSNFVAGSVVKFNGISRPTTFVNSTQLMAVIPSSDVVITNQSAVNVVNPLPGGGTSNSLIFSATAVTTPGLPDTGFNPGNTVAATAMVALIGAVSVALIARRTLSVK